MEEPFQKMPPQKRLQALEEDLNQILFDWGNLSMQQDLLEDQNFLDAVHNHILVLDRHSTELVQSKDYMEVSKLIRHILHTPFGAPFIADTTLLDAAIHYPDEEPKKSHLYSLLKKCTLYQVKGELPLFRSLEMLRDNIHRANQAQKP